MGATPPSKTTGKTRRSKDREKELAYLLYMQTDMTMAEIAEKVGVRPNTVSRWAANDQWQILRSANAVTRKQQIRNYLIQMDELNRQIQSREAGKRYATTQESDIISKLTTAIEKLDKDAVLSNYITVFEQFISFLNHSGRPDLCRMIEPAAHEFITMKADETR